MQYMAASATTLCALQVSQRHSLPRFGEATGPRASMAASMMTLTAAHTHRRQPQQVHPQPCLDTACAPTLHSSINLTEGRTCSATHLGCGEILGLCVLPQNITAWLCLDQANVMLCSHSSKSLCEAPICSLLRVVASGGDTLLFADSPPPWGTPKLFTFRCACDAKHVTNEAPTYLAHQELESVLMIVSSSIIIIIITITTIIVF